MAVNEDILMAFHEALHSSEPVMRMRDFVRSELEHNVPRREVLGQLESADPAALLQRTKRESTSVGAPGLPLCAAGSRRFGNVG